MSYPLNAILAIAADASPVTCTLSPQSVQVLFYALSAVRTRRTWLGGEDDQVTDTDWATIEELLDQVSNEILQP